MKLIRFNMYVVKPLFVIFLVTSFISIATSKPKVVNLSNVLKNIPPESRKKIEERAVELAKEQRKKAGIKDDEECLEAYDDPNEIQSFEDVVEPGKLKITPKFSHQLQACEEEVIFTSEDLLKVMPGISESAEDLKKKSKENP